MLISRSRDFLNEVYPNLLSMKCKSEIVMNIMSNLHEVEFKDDEVEENCVLDIIQSMLGDDLTVSCERDFHELHDDEILRILEITKNHRYYLRLSYSTEPPDHAEIKMKGRTISKIETKLLS